VTLEMSAICSYQHLPHVPHAAFSLTWRSVGWGGVLLSCPLLLYLLQGNTPPMSLKAGRKDGSGRRGTCARVASGCQANIQQATVNNRNQKGLRDGAEHWCCA
jgi:hypothetical protein